MSILFPFSFLKTPASSVDPDAQAFIDAVITAGGSLTSDQQEAINNKVLNLKGQGPQNSTVNFWSSRMRYCFPYVGGVEASMAIELKSLNTGTFSGPWTFDSTGALGDGIDTYFDIGINQLSAFDEDSMGLFEDIGNNFSPAFKALHGLVDGTQGNTFVINDGSNQSWFVLTQIGTDGIATTTQANTIGYWGHRQNGNTLSFTKEDSVISSLTAAPLTALNANIYVGANNFTGGGPTWICDGLFRTSEGFDYITDSELTILKNINAAFQSAVR